MKYVIASGPVIIEKEKVLLVKAGKDNFWKFPGGQPKKGESLEATCRREVKEELGISVKLIKSIKPLIVRRHDSVFISITYLAKRQGKIKSGRNTRQHKWFPLNKLPRDLGPNIKPVIQDYLKYYAKSKKTRS